MGNVDHRAGVKRSHARKESVDGVEGVLNYHQINISVLTVFMLFLLGCSESSRSGPNEVEKLTSTLPLLEVYKQPSCGCCGGWVTHTENHGFQAIAHNQEDLSAFKIAKGISSQFQSCHTAVSEQGYVFEGHIPAKVIDQFISEKPQDAIGLAVPGMPLGSPGMEMGDRFMPYDVLLLKKDGTSEVYVHVSQQQEQY